jgi:SAM-dependent methyltransferase
MPTDPADHYDEYGEHEWERLEQGLYGRLEWEETVHWLTQELPESGRVLDAGGGAGRYAVWLADQGYDVDLVDPSERQVELATGKASERGVADSVHTQVGDVRDLSFDDHTFDATLCLGGPLSHVLDEAGREQAAAELARVTADGGPVFVSVMGKLAALQTITRMAGKVPEEEDETELLPALAEAGDYDEELVASIGQELTAPPMHLFRVHC